MMEGSNELRPNNFRFMFNLLHRNSETHDFYEKPILVSHCSVFPVLDAMISWFCFIFFFFFKLLKTIVGQDNLF